MFDVFSKHRLKAKRLGVEFAPAQASAAPGQPQPPAASTTEAPKPLMHPVLAVVFVLALFIVSQIVAVALVFAGAAMAGMTSAEATHWFDTSPWGQFLFILLAEAMTIGTVYLVLKRKQLDFRAIGFRKPQWSDLGWAVLLLLPYFIVLVVSLQLLGVDTDKAQELGFSQYQPLGGMLLVFVSLVVLPPLAEEIIMRGFLYTVLRRTMPFWVVALFISSLFGFAHLFGGKEGEGLLWSAFVDTFILSMFIVYLREKTKSLWAPIFLHALKNSIAFLMLFVFHVV